MSAFASSADRVHSRRAETSIVSALGDSRCVYTNWPFKIAIIREKWVHTGEETGDGEKLKSLGREKVAGKT